MPLAFPEGQRAPTRSPAGRARRSSTPTTRRTASTWNSSPKAYKKGWLPESFWTRQWEADMESSFAAKKSAVMCHGPWTFDKTMSDRPDRSDGRLPRHPAGQGPGTVGAASVRPGIDTGSMAFFMRTGNETKPNYETIKDFYIWWNSPDTVRHALRGVGLHAGHEARSAGRVKGGQWDAVTSQIEVKGGKYEACKWERTVSGETQMGPRRNGGSPGTWDKESGNIAKNWADLMTEKITVQQYLDMAQKNYEASFSSKRVRDQVTGMRCQEPMERPTRHHPPCHPERVIGSKRMARIAVKGLVYEARCLPCRSGTGKP